MKIDISRDTFDQSKHYSRVLMQQGRVQLDADWNEQVEIQLRQLRALAEDLGGPSWGPGNSLRVWVGKKDKDSYPLLQMPGHYYVRGIRCDLGEPPTSSLDLPPVFASITPSGYKAQDDTVVTGWEDRGGLLVVLTVLERVVTALENPLLAEVALGGADTAARTEVVSAVAPQLADARVTKETAFYYKVAPDLFDDILKGVDPATVRGTLNVQTHAPVDSKDPCHLPADSHFTGLENQLFRVEIWTAEKDGKATFVWAPDNAWLVARWDKTSGSAVTISGGVEGLSSFQADDWVELTDDKREAAGTRGDLFKVKNVLGSTLILDTSSISIPPRPDAKINPKARRWGTPGKRPVPVPVNGTDSSVLLRDGVKVQFGEGQYQSGDYWLIPARTILGDVQWPGEDAQPEPKPEPQPPKRPIRYEAPLAFVEKPGAATDPPPAVVDLRRSLPAPARPMPYPAPTLAGLVAPFPIDNNKLIRRLVAVGVTQLALDKTTASPLNKWTLDDIGADLFDENGAVVGRHYWSKTESQLVWESFDGSKLTAAPVLPGSPSTFTPPSSKDIAWEVYTPISKSGDASLFGNADTVARLFTVSDPLPDPATKDPTSPIIRRFLATYCFYSK